MASPLAQMLSGAIGAGIPQPPVGGIRGGPVGAGKAMPPPPLRAPRAAMPGVKKGPLPGKPVHADKETKKEQKGETKASEKAEGYRRER